jgi:hypothetical protein
MTWRPGHGQTAVQHASGAGWTLRQRVLPPWRFRRSGRGQSTHQHVAWDQRLAPLDAIYAAKEEVLPLLGERRLQAARFVSTQNHAPQVRARRGPSARLPPGTADFA